MTSELLLAEHLPVLLYDTLEWCFVGSAEQWIVGNELRRADGTVIARQPELTLDFLRPHKYANGQPVLPGDVIGHNGKDYHKAYTLLRQSRPELNDVVYGRVVTQDGVMWLQYWFFYYYNGFPGGMHEGDWEMCMVRLGADDAPDLLACAQHRVGSAYPWSTVQTIAGHPIIYVGWLSHACLPAPGWHEADHVDGRRWAGLTRLDAIDPHTHAWMLCGVHWGDTTDTTSPSSPGSRRQWRDPNGWLKVVAPDARVVRAP
jgi:hypothetical protein